MRDLLKTDVFRYLCINIVLSRKLEKTIEEEV